MFNRVFILAAACILAAGMFGCKSVPKVERVDVGQVIDYSGNWNDTDSQLVSQEMMADATSRPWVDEYISKKGTKPRVIVGTISNKSHEHINTETFVKDLERELTNTRRVIFVASRDQRDEVREERVDQAKNASMETAKDMGQEYGADYMLKGQINTILDEAGKMQLKYYQVELELIDTLTNEKAWIGQKKIKKTVKR